ncbi:GNAT family N-acetyltransferase [Nevskia ramosa]|uniref:GNAT family N-acetyltransferase n=1 Tax=Nevskia ramosa TaxID=64002 RepID=UPI003D0DE800
MTVAPQTAGTRPYRPEDRAACLAAFDSNVPVYFDASERADFEAFLDQHPGRYFVAMDADGQVQGCAGYALNTAGEAADLCWAMVHRQQHRAGLGRLLLDARLQAIRSEGSVREVRLSTSQHAAGFYQRFGFVTKLIVPGGFAPGIDRCDMVLALI